MSFPADAQNPNVRRVSSVEDIENLPETGKKFRVQIPTIVYREVVVTAKDLRKAIISADKTFNRRWNRGRVAGPRVGLVRIANLIVADSLKAFRGLGYRKVFACLWSNDSKDQVKEPGQAEAIFIETPIEVPDAYWHDQPKTQWSEDNERAA